MVTLTNSAIEKLKGILVENQASTYGVRIFVAGGGCCGAPSLAMDIAEDPFPDDTALEMDGLRLFLDKEANIVLSEATIDYSQEQGFIISGMPKSDCCG